MIFANLIIYALRGWSKYIYKDRSDYDVSYGCFWGDKKNGQAKALPILNDVKI
jgi:hypothetical protein